MFKFTFSFILLFIIIQISCRNQPIYISKQLDFLEGTYTFKGQPVTGIVVQNRENGYYLFKKEIKNGLLEGNAEYYYENGSIETIENYQNNILEGEQKILFESGKPNSLIYYHMGLKNGLVKEYLIDYSLFYQGVYQNDLPADNWLYFIENDTILIEEFDDQGKLNFISTTSDFNINKTIKKDTLEVTIQKNTPLIRFSGTYIQNKREGNFVFKSDQSEIIIQFSNNKRNGTFLYKKNNQLLTEGNYQNDYKIGSWKYLDHTRYEVIKYQNGKIAY